MNIVEREERDPGDSPEASPPPRAGAEAPARGRFADKTRQRYLRRGLPLSALLHGLVLVAAIYFLADIYLLGDGAQVSRTELVSKLEQEPALELVEEIIEPPPEPETPDPQQEPELVEARFVPEELPPDEPAPEPLDWLPPTDPLSQLETWKVRPPVEVEVTPAPEPVPEPLPEPLPEPQPRGPSDVDVPEVLEKIEPSYPRKAVRLGWEGTVRLRITVDGEGRVTRVEVMRSSGRALLDEAAVSAFERWRFRPRRAGEPQLRRFEKPFTFRLN